jgi:hypothetical protein
VLSDSEQQRLTEIESGLRLDDPAFVQQFGNRGRRRSERWWRTGAALLGLSIAVTLAGFGLVLSNAGIAVAGLTAVGVGVALWITRRPKT